MGLHILEIVKNGDRYDVLTDEMSPLPPLAGKTPKAIVDELKKLFTKAGNNPGPDPRYAWLGDFGTELMVQKPDGENVAITRQPS